MAALGTPRSRQPAGSSTRVAGAFAGAAGALSAQTNGIVGLDSLGFALSAEALVMLVLGGAGRLYGAIVGAAMFMTLHHTASSINPYHWLFVIGGLLMFVVLVPPASAGARTLRAGGLRARRDDRRRPSEGGRPQASARMSAAVLEVAALRQALRRAARDARRVAGAARRRPASR